jgi:ABC-2 type transport system permease protein
MIRSLVIAKKEIASAFNSPVAYIVSIAFAVASGSYLFFARGFFAADRATLRPLFEIMPALLVALAPAITMRSWAEERRQGTFELLTTLPFSPGQLALGKFAGAMAILAAMLALTLPIPILASFLGDFDIGQLACEYVGALFLGAAALSIGQFASSLSRNQVSAFVLGAALLTMLSFAPLVVDFLPLPREASGAIRWISMNAHFSSFAKGVLDSRDIAYFTILSLAFGAATAHAISPGRVR